MLLNNIEMYVVHHCPVLFNVAPKHKCLWHMGQQARYPNPRQSNTGLDETFMGVIKDFAKSCSHGSDPHKIHLNVVEAYRLALHLYLKYGDEFSSI